jgi:hypothetical protein
MKLAMKLFNDENDTQHDPMPATFDDQNKYEFNLMN